MSFGQYFLKAIKLIVYFKSFIDVHFLKANLALVFNCGVSYRLEIWPLIFFCFNRQTLSSRASFHILECVYFTVACVFMC